MKKMSKLIGAAFLAAIPSHVSGATLLNVDFDNALPNKNGQEQGTATFPIPGGPTVTAVSHTGAGMSTADGHLYFIDDIWSGHEVLGGYQVINNGVGSIDSIPTGGLVLGGIHYADGLPERQGDANGIYLGLGLSGNNPSPYAPTGAYNRETAHWIHSFTLTEETAIEFSYQWAAAMGTIPGAGDVLAGVGLNMSSEFFFDTDLDYSNGVSYKFTSAPQTYIGAGSQTWTQERATTTLAANTYYFGLSLSTTQPRGTYADRYIVADGVQINSVPEPSALFLGLSGILPLFRRRRHS